jgi:hypothetical protein
MVDLRRAFCSSSPVFLGWGLAKLALRLSDRGAYSLCLQQKAFDTSML